MILITILTILLMIAVIVAAFTLGLGTTVFIIIFGDIIVGLVMLGILLKKLTTPKTNKKSWVQFNGLFSFSRNIQDLLWEILWILEVLYYEKKRNFRLIVRFCINNSYRRFMAHMDSHKIFEKFIIRQKDWSTRTSLFLLYFNIEGEN